MYLNAKSCLEYLYSILRNQDQETQKIIALHLYPKKNNSLYLKTTNSLDTMLSSTYIHRLCQNYYDSAKPKSLITQKDLDELDALCPNDGLSLKSGQQVLKFFELDINKPEKQRARINKLLKILTEVDLKSPEASKIIFSQLDTKENYLKQNYEYVDNLIAIIRENPSEFGDVSTETIDQLGTHLYAHFNCEANLIWGGDKNNEAI